jgi:hypothetical protein
MSTCYHHQSSDIRYQSGFRKDFSLTTYPFLPFPFPTFHPQYGKKEAEKVGGLDFWQCYLHTYTRFQPVRHCSIDPSRKKKQKNER